DHTNPFYRYDPSQCILCGRCVEACQNVQVNETLSIRWEDPHPRVLWDGGAKIGESSCVSCGHCVTVCPCNALMETTMLGHAGFLTTPLVRDGDGFRAVTWDEALDLVARRLSEIKTASGPDAIGLIASSKCTNEESYLMQKLARAVIGTNNVDNCSRYCQAPATMGL